MYATNIYQKEFELTIQKENEQFLSELNDEIKNVKNKDKVVIPVIIDMSCQSDGIIKFYKTDDDKIIDKFVQIYLHRLHAIEKFLEPIILTKTNKHKMYRVISNLKFDGYTSQSILDDWINKNNINQYVIYY